jgi:acylphosphatase
VEGLVAWCRRGPPSAQVASVEVEWGAPTGEPGPFAVRR